MEGVDTSCNKEIALSLELTNKDEKYNKLKIYTLFKVHFCGDAKNLLWKMFVFKRVDKVDEISFNVERPFIKPRKKFSKAENRLSVRLFYVKQGIFF